MLVLGAPHRKIHNDPSGLGESFMLYSQATPPPAAPSAAPPPQQHSQHQQHEHEDKQRLQPGAVSKRPAPEASSRPGSGSSLIGHDKQGHNRLPQRVHAIDPPRKSRKMDGMTKRINQLAQHVLPDRPHHLSLDRTARYSVPPTGHWQAHPKLMYSTYVGEADRGVLVTLPYYEICEQPDTSRPEPGAAAPRSEAKKALTKMSFKDYQQSKQKKSSASPPDTGPSAPPKAVAKGNTSSQSGTAISTTTSKETKGTAFAKDSESREDAPVRSRLEANGDSRVKSLPSKPPPPSTKSTQSPAPAESRKRAAELDDSTRPHKRTKSDTFTKTASPSSSTPQSDTQRSRDVHGSQEKISGRDTGPSTNGRGVSAGGHSRNHSRAPLSPKPITNGAKAHAPDSRQSTPRKGDAAAKSSLPPLLSPLRFSLDSDHDPPSGSPRPRPPESAGGHLKPPPRMSKAEATSAPPPAAKRRKSPVRIPELLSPTLPPIIEEELARLKKTQSKGGSGGDLSLKDIKDSILSETPAGARRARPPAEGGGEEEPQQPQRCMVVIKYKKKYAKVVQRLLALQPASQKEALRKERSISIENTPPPVARKRPAPTDTPPAESTVASKRPRATSDNNTTSSSRPAAPSTPLKTTAMSRAASSNSLAQTPGDSANLTPGAAERPPTSHSESAAAAAAGGGSSVSLAVCRQRSEEYTRLGTKIKHDRDDIIKPRVANGVAGGGALTQSEKKLVAALSLEMVMSYMIAFKNLNQARSMDRRPPDYRAWEGLMPHLYELRNTTRLFKPLEALAHQLHAICLEQLIVALSSHDISAVGVKLLSATKRRTDAWTEAHTCAESVGDAAMHVTIGPWHTVEEAVRAMLPILRLWAEREHVAWDQKIPVPSSGAQEEDEQKQGKRR